MVFGARFISFYYDFLLNIDSAHSENFAYIYYSTVGPIDIRQI